MKTNCGQRYTHICQIAKRIFIMLLLVVSGLFAATWNIKEASSVFSYKWEIGQDELTEFVKNGQIIKSGISGSFFYNGRYYPVYTTIVDNMPGEIAYQMKNKEILTLNISEITMDYDDIDPSAIDMFDVSALTDFVSLQEVPGIGTLIEITPFLPKKDGSIVCLTSADIQLLSTNSKSLTKANLQRIANTPITLTEQQQEEVDKMLQKIEEDDDVQEVFTNFS